ncbi:hypothetical protein DITRI_Ditri15bG0143200 [Diplodiscus trichospermus]
MLCVVLHLPSILQDLPLCLFILLVMMLSVDIAMRFVPVLLHPARSNRIECVVFVIYKTHAKITLCDPLICAGIFSNCYTTYYTMIGDKSTLPEDVLFVADQLHLWISWGAFTVMTLHHDSQLTIR